MPMAEREQWTVRPEERGLTLAALVRARLDGTPWRRVQGWIRGGRVAVDGVAETDPGRRLGGGEEVGLDLGAAARPAAAAPRVEVVHEDSQVVVIVKPAGVSSVPFDEGERDSALQQLLVLERCKSAGRRVLLYVVQRIDRDTSGLLVFARTKAAERILGAQLRIHSMDRSYLCVAHGAVREARIESRLVVNRGDGLRGSTSRPGQGKTAVTFVRPLQALAGATLCEVRLETGRTHQIRIHMAERGHPLVGERVYVRDFERSGGELIPASRLMLHAATLGFRHPDGRELRFEREPPDDFRSVVTALAREA